MGAPQLYHSEREGWVRHSTRVMPIPGGTEVEPWFGFGRGGRPHERNTYRAEQLNWSGFNEETRIKGYRIISSPEEEA